MSQKERAENLLDSYLIEPRLGHQITKTKQKRFAMLMNLTAPSTQLLPFWEKRYRGTWFKVIGKRKVTPSPKEIIEYKVLAKVAASVLGGPLATSIQESVWSRAAGAELTKSASRTNPENLSLRVFNIMNQAWRDPIAGSNVRLFTLKSKNI